jgi:hypothetical protein
MNKASTQYLYMSTHEPLETRKNQNELLLQKDALIFLLQCKQIFAPSNLTPVEHPFATSEGTFSRS